MIADLILVVTAIPALLCAWWLWQFPNQTISFLSYQPYGTQEQFEVFIKHWACMISLIVFVVTFIYKIA